LIHEAPVFSVQDNEADTFLPRKKSPFFVWQIMVKKLLACLKKQSPEQSPELFIKKEPQALVEEKCIVYFSSIISSLNNRDALFEKSAISDNSVMIITIPSILPP